MKNSNKLIVILGPTASGKTALSIKLAKKFNGEVVSADSRQVYQGLDIGSGKITKKEMAGIPHHLLDVASPKRTFTVAQFQKLAVKKIAGIQRRGETPFLVGGSGLYIQSVVDRISIPEIKPNWQLRKRLQKKRADELFLLLKKLDPKRATSIDPHNPRRLIRAIEIALGTKQNYSLIRTNKRIVLPKFDTLQIGIKKSSKELKKAVRQRLQKRLKQGMVAEVKKLRKSGVSWKRLEELGLEYRFVAHLLRYAEQAKHSGQAQYFNYKTVYQEIINKLEKEIWHFAKRQITWFKRDKKIHWVKDYKEAENLVKKFLIKTLL